VKKIVFGSWAGKVVDNREMAPDKYASLENLELPLEYGAKQVKAFMSWNGFAVADDKINVVDMACAYLKEVQKLSCGECTIGYLGIKVVIDVLDNILNGRGKEEDIALLQRLGRDIAENTKCDFCASLLPGGLSQAHYGQGSCLQVKLCC